MAEKKTGYGKDLEAYVQDMLARAKAGAAAAQTAGYPEESDFTKSYYAGIPSLYMYGDPEQLEALQRTQGLYGAYGEAGQYDKTPFADIGALYQSAGAYGPTNFGDIEGLYGAGSAYAPTSYDDVESMYSGIGQLTPTQYGDIAEGYRAAGQYAPSDYSGVQAGYEAERGYTPQEYQMADYTARNIQERMSPYEELVANRQRARLKKSYDEARGERELQAIRSGGFGGSGQAIQEEIARRGYLEQMADLDAQSLQGAFESGAGLYGKEIADRLAAQQAGEASRQFGQQADFSSLEGLMAAQQAAEASRQFGQQAGMASLAGLMGTRDAEQRVLEYQKQLQLNVLNGTMDARQAEEASRQFAANLGLAGAEGTLAARQAAEASRQFGKQTEFSGLEGLMGARQQDAAQTAAAKEAEFAGLAGQTESARQQAAMAEQRKNMQLANLGANQAAGQQKEERRLAELQYPLGIAALQGNVVGSLTGGSSAIPQSTQKTSTLQNILGGASAAAGLVAGIGDAVGSIGSLFGAGGGLVPNGLQYRYRGGGLADFEPQYYDMYER